jgi:hypothetical protein
MHLDACEGGGRELPRSLVHVPLLYSGCACLHLGDLPFHQAERALYWDVSVCPCPRTTLFSQYPYDRANRRRLRADCGILEPQGSPLLALSHQS